MARGIEVHQFLPTLGFRDAVASHTLETQRAVAEAGFRGGIWAEDVHPELRRRARPYTDYLRLRAARRRDNVLLYQASTGSHGIVDFFLEQPGPKTLYYHNITPPEFFEPYDPAAAATLARGREELKMLVERVPVAMSASEFNARELSELGASQVAVIPPYLSRALGSSPSAAQTSWLRRTKKGLDLLFVSRIVPHKGHFHLLRVFAAIRAAVDPQARLFVVGAWGPDAYMRELFRLRERLCLTEGVAFTGSVSESHLVSYYMEADVYLSMSQHEGFGLPLVEAMRFGLPVVAYDAGGVAETLGGSGVLVRTLDTALIAELVGRIGTDSSLRDQILERQRARLSEIESLERDRLQVAAIRSVLADAP